MRDDPSTASPPVDSPLPHRRGTWRRDRGFTENLCGRVFKVGEPLHGGNPTLSAMDVGFQWYGKASQLENILGCMKLKDPNITENFRAVIGGKFAPLSVLDNQDTKVDTLINSFNTAMTETVSDVFGKHRPTKKPWVTDGILMLWDNCRELKQKKNTDEGAKLYREAAS